MDDIDRRESRIIHENSFIQSEFSNQWILNIYSHPMEHLVTHPKFFRYVMKNDNGVDEGSKHLYTSNSSRDIFYTVETAKSKQDLNTE